MAQQIQLRRGNTSEWQNRNPVLAKGEMGLEETAGGNKLKIGDGLNTWSNLPYYDSTVDATTSVKGKIKLAGDLSGTSDLPTIPALSSKAPLDSPAFIGIPTAPNPPALDSSNKIATTNFVTTSMGTIANPDATTSVKGKIKLAGDLSGTADLPTVPGLSNKENNISAGTTSQYWRGDKSWQTLDKTSVGLNNADNTSDANKPISSATQTALNGKENNISAGTTSQYWRGDKSWQTLDKTSVGLNNVQNLDQTNPANISQSSSYRFTTDSEKSSWDAKESVSNKGAANGYAPLDAAQKVPTSYLPSFVDDVLEYSSFSFLPATGETGKIYVTLDDNKTYRWGGSVYAEISAGPGSTDAVPEGASNLYFTNARAQSALIPQLSAKENTIAAGTISQYWRGDKSWQTLDKTSVGLGNVDNTSDVNKPISSATQIALNSKYDSSNPNGYETPSQLNTRDANNRNRNNHTGTQASSTISDFADSVRATILTGLSMAVSSSISITDTVLSAFGKLQAQINTMLVDVDPVSTGTSNIEGTSTAVSRADHTHNTVVVRFKMRQTADFVTTSVTHVVITGMTITPNVAGTYLVFYVTTLKNSNNGKILSGAIYRNGTIVSESESLIETAAAYRATVSGMCEVTMNGTTDYIDLRISGNGNTTTASHRNMVMVRIS